MHEVRTEITRLLNDLQHGEKEVINDLFPLVYNEMHRLAQRQRIGWHGDYTLNTTALVHEAYIKLVDQTHPNFENRAHFLAIAAKAMRQILINYAEHQRTQKRGGNIKKLSLEELEMAGGDIEDYGERRAEVLIVLDELLQELSRLSERQGRVVECRFFGGMTIEETAVALGVSPATVKREWVLAQAWLHREVKKIIEE